MIYDPSSHVIFFNSCLNHCPRVHFATRAHKWCNNHFDFERYLWVVLGCDISCALTTHLPLSAFHSSVIRLALGLEDIETMTIHAANFLRIRLVPTVAGGWWPYNLSQIHCGGQPTAVLIAQSKKEETLGYSRRSLNICIDLHHPRAPIVTSFHTGRVSS